jgi:hypothetical protein
LGYTEDRDAGPVRRVLRRAIPGELRARGRSALLNSPVTFGAYCALDPKLRHRRVSRRTHLVLDGFPRSANTYARLAFEHVNGTEWRVSSHLHSPQSIITAVRLGLPTILLVRRPHEVLASTAHLHADLGPLKVITDYVRFHESVLPYVDDVLVADFAAVTSDFGAVLERCNARFGTTFLRYTPDVNSEEAVRARIDAVARQLMPDRWEDVVGRPLPQRRSTSPRDFASEPLLSRWLGVAAALHSEIVAAERSPRR